MNNSALDNSKRNDEMQNIKNSFDAQQKLQQELDASPDMPSVPFDNHPVVSTSVVHSTDSPQQYYQQKPSAAHHHQDHKNHHPEIPSPHLQHKPQASHRSEFNEKHGHHGQAYDHHHQVYANKPSTPISQASKPVTPTRGGQNKMSAGRGQGKERYETLPTMPQHYSNQPLEKKYSNQPVERKERYENMILVPQKYAEQSIHSQSHISNVSPVTANVSHRVSRSPVKTNSFISSKQPQTLSPDHYKQVYRQPVLKSLPQARKQDISIPDRQVEKIMGPEPVPSLDIEMSEIQNELQSKLVEEIVCVMCGLFPFHPKECRKCNKLLCKHCQLQLTNAVKVPHNEDEFADPELHKVSEERLSQMSAFERKSYNSKMASLQNKARGMGTTPGYDVCCPNCQERGDFMQEVNKVVRNCVDFCEFPHHCYINSKRGEIIWKTMNELQEHALFDCPKFGCDICYHEDFQKMTRAQLFKHIKYDCTEVTIQCQVCMLDFTRGEFIVHTCLKEKYLARLQRHHMEVVDFLAEYLVRLRRYKEGLGLCVRPECVERYRKSTHYKAGQGMVNPNVHNQAAQCKKCKTVVPGFEESFFCMYCNDCYCSSCLGYNKHFDMAELDNLIRP